MGPLLKFAKKSLSSVSRISFAKRPLPLMRKVMGRGLRSASTNNSHSPSGTMSCGITAWHSTVQNSTGGKESGHAEAQQTLSIHAAAKCYDSHTLHVIQDENQRRGSWQTAANATCHPAPLQ